MTARLLIAIVFIVAFTAHAQDDDDNSTGAKTWPLGCRVFALTSDQPKSVPVYIVVTADDDIPPPKRPPVPDQPDVLGKGLEHQGLETQGLEKQSLPKQGLPKATLGRDSDQRLLKLNADRKTFTDVTSDTSRAAAGWTIKPDGIYSAEGTLTYQLKGNTLYSNPGKWEPLLFFDPGTCPNDIADILRQNQSLLPVPKT